MNSRDPKPEKDQAPAGGTPAPEPPLPEAEGEPIGTTTLELPAELLREYAQSHPAAEQQPGDAPPAGGHRAGPVAGTVIVLALLVGVLAALMGIGMPALVPQSNVPQPTATPTAAPTATPGPDPAAEAFAAVQEICTGSAPQMTDPATWNEAGKALMDELEKDAYYQEFGFTAEAAAIPERALAMAAELREMPKKDRPAWTRSTPEWQDALAEVDAAAAGSYPYLLAVNRAASTVTVFTADAGGRYTVPYMAMVCSGGESTPTGFWCTPIRYNWRLLEGPCYGQYATRIWNGFLFHSVPYYVEHKDDLEYDQFNQLGEAVSLGCIRLAAVDVKWIYDNCPPGTPVVIYDNAADPGPMGKPGTIRTDPADETLRGWDPTDPDPANPWPAQYRRGTAIRSLAALEEWNAAQADGRWIASINETDLQGWSHDSSKEGTRG